MAGYFNFQEPNRDTQKLVKIEKIFSSHAKQLQKVKEFGWKIRSDIEKISPFIDQSTRAVCPDCKNICCIKKHGHYNYEDILYLNALGLKPPSYEFEGKDTDPCHFLSENGCTLDRQFRPSGCNWYFCDSLLNHIEQTPTYQKFDDILREIAERWLAMLDEFDRIASTI
jgi:hypothetical protein